MLVEDLRISHEKNVQRLIDNPSRMHYRGTILVVEIYYKNILGQWFKNIIRKEICWLNDKNAPPRKTHNINENTIPPCPLNDDTEFELNLISPRLSIYSTNLAEASEIEDKLKQYKEFFEY